jgi:hypothetical protein
MVRIEVEILASVGVFDRLCGLVVRVPGYRFGGPGFDSRHYPKKKVVGLEWGLRSRNLIIRP